MKIEEIMDIEPYSLERKAKEKLLTERLIELTELHRERCSEYKKITDCLSYEKTNIFNYKDIPFLPVRLFKNMDIKSVSNDDVIKIMTSSGTTGQAVSKIYIDKKTAINQQKIMTKIVSDFIGSGRLPMIIIDCPSIMKERKIFSARRAGILGFSIFGSKKFYALDENMKLDVCGLTEFLAEHRGEKILLFGFTYMIWEYFYKELKRLKEKGVIFDLSECILIHGGGWKKLEGKGVDFYDFHNCFKEVCGLNRIHDYYGMVEQTGCIYMQCECGYFHASIFSDIITRRTGDFAECDFGEKGIIQVVSVIPESYPGHSLLTEDEGIVIGEDNCSCGRKGKYFKIVGRFQNAEVRGCSDTYELQ